MELVSSEPLLQAADVERFSRQIICEGIGPTSMGRLLQAHAVIVGLGGLGSTAALYLTAAGIGHLTFIDGDCVEVSNLHRQVIHTTHAAHGMEDVLALAKGTNKQETSLPTELQTMSSVQVNDEKRAMLKVDSARARCQALRPEVNITTIACYVNVDNVESLLSCNCDVIVDCSDNMGVRYLINDAAMRLRVPVVSGSAMRWEGQLTIYGLHHNDTSDTHEATINNKQVINNNNNNSIMNKNNELHTEECGRDAQKEHVYSGSSMNMEQNNKSTCPCYRCLYPVPPPMIAVGNCSDNGVLGPIPGMIGCLQALEVIKIIARTGTTLAGRLFIFDGFNFTTRVVKLRGRQANCVACGAEAKKNAHLPLRAFIKERPEYLRYCNNLCGTASCTREHSSHQVLQNNNNATTENVDGNINNHTSNVHSTIVQQCSSIMAEHACEEINQTENRTHLQKETAIISSEIDATRKDAQGHISVTEFAQRMKETCMTNSETNHDYCNRKHHSQKEVLPNENATVHPTNNDGIKEKQKHHEEQEDAIIMKGGNELRLCVDVRTPVQFDMAHLHNSFSLPLETIEKWARDTSMVNALERKCVEFIRSAAVQTWRAERTNEECNVLNDQEHTECHGIDNVWCDKEFVRYWLAIHHCSVFVICRRGIASVKAVHLLQRATDVINERHVAQKDDKEENSTHKLHSPDELTLPFIVHLYNVDGGLNCYSKTVDEHFPYY